MAPDAVAPAFDAPPEDDEGPQLRDEDADPLARPGRAACAPMGIFGLLDDKTAAMQDWARDEDATTAEPTSDVEDIDSEEEAPPN